VLIEDELKDSNPLLKLISPRLKSRIPDAQKPGIALWVTNHIIEEGSKISLPR